MHAFDETTLLLQEWSKWIWINRGVVRGYPGRATFARQISSRPSPMINDLVAGEVDLAVAQLCHHNEDMGRATALYFISGVSLRDLARKMGYSVRKVTELVNAGVAQVSDVLDSE
jgi:hypothetical protein